MIAYPKEEMTHIKLPQEWYKGIFEISAEDPFSNLMLVWIVGDSARSADRLSDEIIKKDIGNLLNTFLNRTDIPPPDFLYRNCWTRDEFAMGTYSTSTLKMTKKTFQNLARPLPSFENPRLLFAGEATHEKFWSFLHGARESGIREAERILSFFHKK